MAYLGQDPVVGRYILIDQISGGFNGTASGFNLAAGGQGVIPGLAQNLILSLGGVIQQPSVDYTVSGSGLTFTTAPTSGTTFFATVLGDVQSIGTPSDGTVSLVKLNAVGGLEGQTFVVNSSGQFVFGSPGAAGAGGDQIFFLNEQNVTVSYSIPSGFNAGTFGPCTIASGVTVTIPGGSSWVIV